MLGKLIKYEIRATYKLMLTLFAAFAALSAVIILGVALDINELVVYIGEKYGFLVFYIYCIEGLIIGLYITFGVFMCTLMFFYGIKRFHDELLGHRGYVMHLLPVKTSMHIITKGSVALFWNILGILGVIISAFLYFCWVEDNTLMKTLGATFEFFSEIDIYSAILVLEYIIVAILAMIQLYMRAYASMAVGYSFNKYRLLISVGVYFIVDFVLGLIESLFVVPLSMIITAFCTELINYSILHILILGVNLVTTAITILVYYYATHYFLSKRLNLQ